MKQKPVSTADKAPTTFDVVLDPRHYQSFSVRVTRDDDDFIVERAFDDALVLRFRKKIHDFEVVMAVSYKWQHRQSDFRWLFSSVPFTPKAKELWSALSDLAFAQLQRDQDESVKQAVDAIMKKADHPVSSAASS